MSGLILPGGVPAVAQKKDEAPAYESLTEEQKAAVDALAAKEEPEYDRVETAFVVIKTLDGSYGIRPYGAVPVAPEREADENDYLSAFEIIKTSLLAQMTAATVQQGMMQQAAFMQQQMQEAALRRNLKL